MIAFVNFPSWISPTIVPGLPIRWYGIMYLAAFGITFALFQHEMRRNGACQDRDQITDFFFWTIFGLLLGSRLLYVAMSDVFGDYLAQPWTIVWPFREGRFTGIQGMSYHGGLIGAIVAAVVYCRIKRLDVLEWGDALAVCAPLGYSLGRIGNFINGELAGRVTTLGLGVLFPAARRFPATEDWVPATAERVGVQIYDPAQLVNLPRHPSQLYEAILEGLLLWVILWFVVRTRRPFKGALLGLYLVGYGIARFMAGYFRETDEVRGFVLSLGEPALDPALVSHGLALSGGQLISLAMIVVGFAALAIFRLLHTPAPTVETFD